MENISSELKSLLGNEFNSNKRNNENEKALSSKVLGLFFSAHWCKACQDFTLQLKEFYENLKSMCAELEIIFISSDHDVNSYKKYLDEMPWIAIPFGDHRLAVLKTKFRVIEIPCLIFVDVTTGEILSNEGRDIVCQEDYNKLLDWSGFNN